MNLFSTLLESRRTAETPIGGAVLSAVVHVALMSAVLALSVARAQPRIVLTPERISGYVRLPLSPDPAPDVGAGDRTRSTRAASRKVVSERSRRRALVPPPVDVDVSALAIPDVTVEIDYMAQAVDFEELQRPREFGRTAGRGTSAGGYRGGAYLAHQVEKVAISLPGSPQPAYPESLLRWRRQGRVDIEFVVDTLGRVDTTSVRVLDSAHPMFTHAVRDVLPFLEFLPAESGGRKVPMLVAQPFSFVIR